MMPLASPNFNERTAPNAITYVMLHYTGMQTAAAAIERLCDPAAKVSAHYVIHEDGSLLQLVEESHRAWHAGHSFWRGERDLNNASIGIELINPGHEFGYRAFPAAQIETTKTLVRGIMDRYDLPASALLGHSDVAPTRRFDPGELFPWQTLAQDGLGLWPAPSAEDYEPSKSDESGILLRTIGFECPDHDPTASEAAHTAFLRHYHPERLSLGWDAESLARARALARG